MIWQDGEKHVGEWLNVLRHGHGTMIWQNGEKHVGEWLNGFRHGHGVLKFAEHKLGFSYEGGCNFGKFSGNGTFIWKDGEKYAGEYLNHLRHGRGVETYPENDGLVELVMMADGEKGSSQELESWFGKMGKGMLENSKMISKMEREFCTLPQTKS